MIIIHGIGPLFQRSTIQVRVESSGLNLEFRVRLRARVRVTIAYVQNSGPSEQQTVI